MMAMSGSEYCRLFGANSSSASNSSQCQHIIEGGINARQRIFCLLLC
jgi:hypothetical protein